MQNQKAASADIAMCREHGAVLASAARTFDLLEDLLDLLVGLSDAELRLEDFLQLLHLERAAAVLVDFVKELLEVTLRLGAANRWKARVECREAAEEAFSGLSAGGRADDEPLERFQCLGIGVH